MASFQPPPQKTPDPSYVGQSQAPSMREAQMANKGFETLFSGLGDVVTGAAKTADNEITDNIKTDVYGKVDPIRDSQGVALAAANADVGGKPLQLASASLSDNKPPNAQGVTDNISKLTEAWKQGKFSDTDYYARLEAATRQVRARYPGYREDVDQMIQQVTGVTPANALRKSIESDLATAQSTADQAKNKEQTFYNSNQQYLQPDFYQKAANGNPYSYLETQAYVAKQKQDDQTITAERSRISLAKDRNELNAGDAESTAMKELNMKTQKLMNDGTQAAGGLGGLQAKIVALAGKGTNISPQEQQQLAASFTQLEMAHRNMIDNTLNQPFGKNGESYASIIGPEKTKKLRDNALEQMAGVKQMLTDQNFGALFMNQNAMKAMGDSDTRQLLEKYPVMRNLQAISSMPGGKEFLQAAMARGDNKGLNEVMTAVTDTLSNARRAGTSDSTPTDQLKEGYEQSKKKGPGFVKAYVNGMVTDLSDPSAPPQATANTAKALFSDPSFLKSFTPDDKANIYTRLTDPKVTQKILASGDKELWSSYSTWAKGNFQGVFQDSIMNMKDLPNREWIDVKYDPKANQFSVVPTQSGIDAAKNFAGGMNPLNWLERRYNSSVSSSVDKINRGLKTLEPIMKQDGYDVGKEMGSLLSDTGIQQGAAKNNTLFGSMRHAWDAAYSGAQPGQESFGGSQVNPTQPSGGKLEGTIPLDFDPHTAKSASEHFGSGVDINQLPAGMRNNNPGNIKYWGQANGVIGPSKNLDQGDPQAVFASPEVGMQAAARLALKKFNSGKQTIDDLIAGNNGWTPGNHQAAANIAATMGVGPRDQINLTDKAQMAQFLRGLVKQEHGPSHKLYTDDFIRSNIPG
jgi:hypothetical protein